MKYYDNDEQYQSVKNNFIVLTIDKFSPFASHI